MGHCIQVIIGAHAAIQNIADNWNYAQEIELPQGYGMIFLTNALLEDITELFDVPDEEFGYPVLTILPWRQINSCRSIHFVPN